VVGVAGGVVGGLASVRFTWTTPSDIVKA